MLRFMLRAKIHRATVTESDINYEGSLTVGIRTMSHLLLDCLEQQSALEPPRP